MFWECYKKPKLTPARFFSLCIVINDNVVVLDGKLPYKCYLKLVFTHSAMLLEEKLTPTRFSSWCNVFDNNVVVLDEKLPYES